ncbi:signal transduction histidine kinase [Actinoallomurus bryophytorum]|uniref:histidine kinase n=1 Tax=Actinoallomurus bryophytorum TaxID=1490222 RepID=A0A543CNU5_9ACTN|nr:sensor histidine kinase [Actinoallomurus bryophytorum]TQL98640.1 signal transduction histidine kinase [Actinoallomurus bryophytorum]
MNIRTTALAAVRGLGLALLAMVGSLVLFILMVVSISLTPVVIGVVLVPLVARLARSHANLRRRLAYRWFGVEIKEPYRPKPHFQGGLIGALERYRWVMMDRATWRDLLWMICDATAGFTLAIFAFSLPFYGPYGWVLALGVWRPIVHSGGNEWYTFVPISDQATATIAGLVGFVYAGLGLWLTPKTMHLHSRLTAALLAPTHERELELRVARLTETRSDALDSQAAELRRIERDLHDGAQARLVAMGMSLGAIEHLLERDPKKAKVLLSEARESSSKALTELRDLVRGIHPPVLAERGLGDAVRALAMASPLQTEVSAEIPGRIEAPVESAAYFAVSEILTNAAKHSGARRVWLDLRHENGMLRIVITDDGQGGAAMSHGTGISGIERRIGTFDGVLALNSPVGGPTMVTMELPCELSSPQP